MKKRGLSIILTLVMTLSMLVEPALAVKSSEAGFNVAHEETTNPAWSGDGSIRLSKSAEWVDTKNGVAKIAITVEGKNIVSPVEDGANIVLLVDTTQGMYKPDGYCASDVYDPEKGEYYCKITKEYYSLTSLQTPETPNMIEGGRNHRTMIAQTKDINGKETGGRMVLVQQGLKDFLEKLSTSPANNVSIVSYGTKGDVKLDWTQSSEIAKLRQSVNRLLHEPLPTSGDIVYREGLWCKKCGDECEKGANKCACETEAGCDSESCRKDGENCKAFQQCPNCGDYCSYITLGDGGELVNNCVCASVTPDTTCGGCKKNAAVPCSGLLKTCERCGHLCSKGSACDCGADGKKPCASCVLPNECIRCGHHCVRKDESGKELECACDAEGVGACEGCLIEITCIRCGHHCRKGLQCSCGEEGLLPCDSCIKESICASCSHVCLKGTDCECTTGVVGYCAYCVNPDICDKCGNLCPWGKGCKGEGKNPCADCFVIKEHAACEHLCLMGDKCTCDGTIGADGMCTCEYCFSTQECPKCKHLCARSEECLCGNDGEELCIYCYTEKVCDKCGEVCKKGDKCQCEGKTGSEDKCKYCPVKLKTEPTAITEMNTTPKKDLSEEKDAETQLDPSAEAVPLAAGAARALLSNDRVLTPVVPGDLPFRPGTNTRNYSAALYEAKKQVEKAQAANDKPTIVIMLSNEPANVGLSMDNVFGKEQAKEIKDLGAEIYGVAICGDKIDVQNGMTADSLTPLISPDTGSAEEIKHLQTADLTDVGYKPYEGNVPKRDKDGKIIKSGSNIVYETQTFVPLSVEQVLEKICAPYMSVKPAATNVEIKDIINDEYFSIYNTTKPGESLATSVPMVSDGVTVEGNTATIKFDKTLGKAQEFFIWVQVKGDVLQFKDKPTNKTAEMTYTDPDGKPGQPIIVESPKVSWVRDYTIKYNLSQANPENSSIPDQQMLSGTKIALSDGRNAAGEMITSKNGSSLKGWIDIFGNQFGLGSEFTSEKAAAMGCNQSVVLQPRFKGIVSFSVLGGKFCRNAYEYDENWNRVPVVKNLPAYAIGFEDGSNVKFADETVPEEADGTEYVVPDSPGATGVWYKREGNTLTKLENINGIPAEDGAHYVLSYIPRDQMVAVVLNAKEHGTIANEKSKLYIGKKGDKLATILNMNDIPKVATNLGWSLKEWQQSDDTAKIINSVTLDEAVNADVIYDAQYNVLVTFNPNGGKFTDGGATTSYSMWISKGSTIESRAVEKSGYIFNGWQANGASFDFTKSVTEPTTLIAQYRQPSDPDIEPPKPQMVVVTLNAAAHGTLDGLNTKKFEGKQGNTLGSILGATAVPAVSAESGWRLAGWQGASEMMSSSSLATAVTSNQTYTAQYDALVTFDSNGGVFKQDGSKTNKTEWVRDGGKLTNIPVAEKAGAKFVGWYEGNIKKDPTLPITRPMILVARYEGSGVSVQKSFEVEHIGAEHSTIRIGDVIKYTISVRNDGDSLQSNIKVTDVMFAKADSSKVLINGSNATVSANTVQIASLGAKETAEITYSYTVRNSDANRTIHNTAVVQAGDSTESADTTTGRVEGMQEIKIYYAAERINSAGTGVSTPSKIDEPIVIMGKYPGQTITKNEIEQAIAKKVVPALASDGIDISNGYSRVFYQAGSSTGWDTSSKEIANSYVVKGSDNRFYVGYPLNQLSITYKPGANGSVEPAGQAKGVAQNGNVVFKIPYGATPAIWFGAETANGALSVATTPNSSYQFNGWQPEPELAQRITQNQTYTAQWRRNDFSVTVEIYANGRLVDTRTDMSLSNITEGAAKLSLDADSLLAMEQSLGKIGRGYHFNSFVKDGIKVTSQSHVFDVRNGDLVRVNYEPYGLSVWHVSGKRRVFDESQSLAVLNDDKLVWANPALVNNAIYKATTVTVDGRSVPGYGEIVNAQSDKGPWIVTFNYTPKSGDEDEEGIDILDPEIPIAPGLNMTDHTAYIVGYTDGMVKPQGNMTRDEIAAVFYRLLDAMSRQVLRTDENPFPDMNKHDWANTEVATLSRGGILTGYEDGNFYPNSFITRAELAAIAARFQSGVYEGEDMFPDISGHWAAGYINNAARYGWVQGKEDGLFHPNEYITRAEVMTLVNNVLYRQVQPEGMLKDMIAWPDNARDKWYYNAVQEATNTHKFDRPTPFDFETWTELYERPEW